MTMAVRVKVVIITGWFSLYILTFIGSLEMAASFIFPYTIRMPIRWGIAFFYMAHTAKISLYPRFTYPVHCFILLVTFGAWYVYFCRFIFHLYHFSFLFINAAC